MAYVFRYRLQQAPTATRDGSGIVMHDIWAEYSENSEYFNVPGRHKSICIPAAELQAIMDLPDGNSYVFPVNGMESLPGGRFHVSGRHLVILHHQPGIRAPSDAVLVFDLLSGLSMYLRNTVPDPDT